MIIEIDKDYYCSIGAAKIGVPADLGVLCKKSDQETRICEYVGACPYKRHKRPTPKQFKEEYGKEVPDDMPVWYRVSPDRIKGVITEWELGFYKDAKYALSRNEIIIACTPFGKPDVEMYIL